MKELHTFKKPVLPSTALSTTGQARDGALISRYAEQVYRQRYGRRGELVHLLARHFPPAAHTDFFITADYLPYLKRWPDDVCVFAYVNLETRCVRIMGWLYHYEITQFMAAMGEGHIISRALFRPMNRFLYGEQR